MLKINTHDMKMASKHMKMLSIISHWENTNRNHSEIQFHTNQDGGNKNKDKNKQLQVLMRKNWNSHAVLVGM